jgi:glycosyltransferase involved in cell wall biosynthesis
VKVLFLTTAYPTEDEPAAGIFVREHALAAARSVDVALVHLDRRPGLRGIRTEQLDGEPFLAHRVSYAATPKPVSAALHTLAARRGVHAVRRSGFEPDLVHAHFFLAGAPALTLRKPVVVSEHWSVFLPEDPATLSPVSERVARETFSRACMVLPVSEALLHGIERTATQANLRVVRNVVDTELFRPAPHPATDPPRLLAVGLLYEAKGYDVLLDALPQLTRSVEVEIVGDGPLRGELEAQAARLGLENVTFAGRLAKPQVADRMRAADLFLLPSRFETSGVAAIEALASGLPVVGSRVGAVPELVGEAEGILVEPGDATALARAIERGLDRVFDRPAIAARVGAAYSAETIGAELAEVYCACVG